MFLVAGGGFLGAYDDKTLNVRLAIAKKHYVKLILCEAPYGGGMFTKLRISAVQCATMACAKLSLVSPTLSAGWLG
jgi:hypothetical protein